MNFTSQTPQPNLAWTFENTAVPYIGSLTTSIVGTGVTYQAGKYLTCIDIPNSGGFQNRVDYSYSGSYAIDTGFSVAFWVKPYTTSGYFLQFYGSAQPDGFGGGPHVTVTFGNNGGKAGATLYNYQSGVAGTGYNGRTAASALSLTTFTHVAATFGNGNITLYINGVAEPVVTYVQNGMTLSSYFRLGSADAWGPASAQYDDLRIYNTALSAAQVQAVYRANGIPSRVVAQNRGLVWSYYTGYFADNVNFFAGVTPVATGSVKSIPNINTGTGGYVPGDGSWATYSVQWTGHFQSDYTGVWTFYTFSDDASYLWIGDVALSGFTTANALVNNGGTHPGQERSGTVSLVAGQFYPIRIQFGENTGGDNIIISFSNPVLAKTTNGFGYLSPVTKFSGAA